MKKALLSIAALVVLAGCSGTPTVTYNLSMDVTDATQRQLLVDQSVNVIERRLESMGDILVDSKTSIEGSGAIITISSESQEALDALTQQLQEPFEMRVMQESSDEEAELTVEGHGGFKGTGISGEDLNWVEGHKEPGKETGEVKLVFTEEGRTKMGALFRAMKGKFIAIFVRNTLVSKLMVDTDELKDDIVIRDVPNAELAQVFAEDVNVGIHVTFTPAQ